MSMPVHFVFISALLDFKKELFEGRGVRLVPKNHWGVETDFEMAGAAVGHSILLGGPGFPYLHPALYAHLALHTLSPDEIGDLPCSDDIPLTASTFDTKEKVTVCRSHVVREHLNSLFIVCMCCVHPAPSPYPLVSQKFKLFVSDKGSSSHTYSGISGEHLWDPLWRGCPLIFYWSEGLLGCPGHLSCGF